MDIGLSKKYRNQYAVILACASAKDEIQNVWKHNDPRFEWVNSNPYSCVLVGSIPTQIAQHPTHGHHQQFKKVGNAPSNILTPICGNIQSIPGFKNVEQEPAYLSEETPKQTPKASTPSPSFDIKKLDKTPENNSNPDDKFMQILAFCKGKESVSVRDVQRSSVGRDLSSDAIKYGFEWLENNGYGTVIKEQTGGTVKVTFTPF